MKKIVFQIAGVRSPNDRSLIETELDVLVGVKNVQLDEKTGRCAVEFDETKPRRGIFQKPSENSVSTSEALSAPPPPPSMNIPILSRECIALPAKF